ncbi:sigma-70 family RNA polymerase sigma factor [candidate division KSB1 bacterium]|nr:sigma-70 family RNA polymerase sigma factor [candidate division KSB1 bacterium]
MLFQRLKPDVVAALCRDYYPRVYRYVAYRLASREDAEDLSSEVFLRLLGYRSPMRLSALALCYKVAENLIIDYYRSRQRRARLIDRDAEVELLIDPDPRADRELTGIDLVNGLRRLTGEQYQVIMLRFIEGYALEEVAAQLGKSIAAVKSLQHRGLVSLREFIMETPKSTKHERA